MPKTPGKPVIFLTFANAAEEGYLKQLKKESALLRDLFLPLHQRDRIELLREESLDSTELPKLLNQYKDRIALFHYGGHAHGEGVSLEDGAGHAGGLAELLRLQEGLKLVFLNGCSTGGQVLPYLEAGIPVVLATTRRIPDEAATYFAEHFYHALLNRHTIREAFLSASGALKTRYAGYKAGAEEIVSFRGLAAREPDWKELPWRLYVQEGREAALNWSLGEALEQDGERFEITTKAPGKGKKNRRARQWLAGAGLIISILAGIAGITGFDLKSLLRMVPVNDSHQLTVYVHGPEGEQDIVLENEGQLVVDFGNRRDTRRIGEAGRTNFGEIDPRFLGAEIGLTVEAGGFEVTHPDTTYIYTGEPIYLAVRRDRSLGRIRGVIRDENGAGLAGAGIMIEGDTIVLTDSLGRFRFTLPPDNIREHYQLSIRKAGYRRISRTYYPNSSLFEVVLDRVENQ